VDLSEAEPARVAASIQFLGACTLSGWMIAPSLLPSKSLRSVVDLLSDVPDSVATSGRMSLRERRLWFGLRAIIGFSDEAIFIQRLAIERTLEFWRADLNETSLEPDRVQHRLNISMVRWLTGCISHAGRLISDDEPLWMLTGFPRDSRLVSSDVYCSF
jgi:hypothetical protein